MTIEVIMPQMGESVYEGTLTKWLKKEGDSVERDEPLFEISTDKVDSEIPSPASGILSEILIPEGRTIKINTILAIIKEVGNKENTSEKRETLQESEQGAGQKTGKESKPESSTAEASREETAGTSGEKETVSEVRVQSMPGAPRLPGSGETRADTPSRGLRVQSIRTSPLVRKIARENGIDLTDIRGSGLGGRITKDDIQKYIDGLDDATTTEQVRQGAPSAATADVPEKEGKGKTFSTADALQRFIGETETVPMSSMRKAIAEHMVLSKRTSAHVNTIFEVDLHAIVRLREQEKAEFEKREGIPLTYTPFFAKALIDTVRDFPIFNASLSGDDIIYKKPVNLGIAVAVESGLIVPVIKNAQLKNLTGIALKIADLAERARAKKLKPEEVQDGTISLTNPGRYGALFATPIISQPQVAILGIGGIEKRPVVVEDAIAIRPMVYLSLTFDHRVIDGALADQFMAALKEKLQNWSQWSD